MRGNGFLHKAPFVLALPLLTVPGQGATRWSLQSTALGFQWVSPSGTVQCKYAGVSTVDNNMIARSGQFPTVVPAKYPTWPLWAAAQNSRLKSWGFNAAGMYSYAFSSGSNYQASWLPFTMVFQVSGHASRDDYPYHVKNLNHNYTFRRMWRRK